MKNLTYSIDLLIPGIYIWINQFPLYIGGQKALKTYPGRIESLYGFALVLPGYRLLSYNVSKSFD